MNILLKLLLLPFKAIDEGLEILVFKVIFHRRLWFITVPATVLLCWWGWGAWKASRAVVAPAPAPTASASPRAARSPAPAVPGPRPAASSSSPSPAAPRPSPSPKAAPPSPAASRPAAPPSARPSVRPPSPAPTRPPAPSAAPPRPPSPAAPRHPAVDLLSTTAAEPTTASLDLAAALAGRPDLAPALTAAKPTPSLTIARILAGDGSLASTLIQLPPAAALAALDATAQGKLYSAYLKHGPRDGKLALLEALAGGERPPPAEAGAALATLLSTRDRALTEAAARAIARLTDRALAPVLEAVSGTLAAEEKVAVARALAAMRSPKAQADLVAGLTSKNNAIRAHALHGLADLGEDSANAPAQEAAADPDYLLRQAAAHVLAEAGEPRAAEVLGADLSSPLDVVRAGALATLGALSEKAQVTVVTHLIGQKSLPGAARLAALRLLAASPARSATPALQTLLANPKGVVRLAVADELHPAQAKMLKPLLLRQLASETVPDVRLALARALPGDPAAEAALVGLATTAPALRPRIAPLVARAAPARLAGIIQLFTPAESASPWGMAALLRAGK